MIEKNAPSHTELLLELGELHSKVIHNPSTLEAKLALIKTSIEKEEYVIHPQRIIAGILEDVDAWSCLPEALPS